MPLCYLAFLFTGQLFHDIDDVPNYDNVASFGVPYVLLS